MEPTSFILDPRLAADTIKLGDLALCSVLLMNEQRFPWVILVPRRAGLGEIFDLEAAGAILLLQETTEVARAARAVFAADKINIAAIGNKIRQLHVHVIARTEQDSAWPGTVWDKGERQPMDTATREMRRNLLLANLRFSVVPSLASA